MLARRMRPAASPSDPNPARASGSQVARAGGFELLHARFEHHAFPRHSHQSYVIELVESGEDAFLCGTSSYRARAGSIVLINPGVVHTGKSVGPCALAYRSFYPEPEQLAAMFGPTGDSGFAVPYFPTPTIDDSSLFSGLAAAHRLATKGAEPLHAASAMVGALTALVQRHARSACMVPVRKLSTPAIDGAREYLHAHFRSRVELSVLATVAGLSPFHFLRRFREATGMPPHLYQQNLRVHWAKEQISCGYAIGATAIQAGFADQAHLTRCFRRVFGVTPSHFAPPRARSFKTR